MEGADQQQPERRIEPRAGDVIADKYEIEAPLGSGAMGLVFAARNLGTGKRVALKWLLTERATDADHIARFHREARMAGRIDHPNVVAIYDVGNHGASTFLVMELLNGRPLRELMDHGPLPATDAVQIIMPALRGIAAAHRENVIHRDLKPENLFLCQAPDGTPRECKVLDFGIAKLADEIREGLSVTQTGAVIGTPFYLSPEQVRGVKDIDKRVDVYAMGVILYEMLARQRPFVADTFTALVLEIATGTPTPLRSLRPDVSEELAAVVARAMHRDREKRFDDIESLGRALEPFAGGLRFRPERPNWTARFAGSPASEEPRPSTTAETSLETVAADTTPELARSAEDRDLGVLDTVTPDATVEAGPALAGESTADVPVVPLPLSKRRWWPWAAGAAVLLVLVVGIAVAVDSPSAPSAPAASTPAAAAPRRTGPPDEDERSSDEVASETAPAAERPPEEPAAEPGPEASTAEEPAAEPSAPRRPRARTRRRTARTAEMAAAPEMTAMIEMTTTATRASMRRHRAGEISLEDF